MYEVRWRKIGDGRSAPAASASADASLVAAPDGYQGAGPGGEVEPEGDAVGPLHHQRSRITGTDRAVDVVRVDQ